MRTQNAFLTEERLRAPSSSSTATLDRPGAAGQLSPQSPERPPIATSPFGGDTGDRATFGGVASATGVLLSMLAVATFVGWNLVESSGTDIVKFPSWLGMTFPIALVLLGVAYMKPNLAKIIGPIYAIVQGVVVGAMSHLYEVRFDGIVLQAAMLTIAVFAAMLFLYSTRIIKVTAKLQKGIIAATMAIMAVYIIGFVGRLVSSSFEIPYLHDSGPIGIVISLVIVGVAAFNYLLDFDFIERSVKGGAPKNAEWVAAFGLLVTTVWLYMEMLRLLSKLRD